MNVITDQTIQQWMKKGRKFGATHFIIVQDSISGRTYPEYVNKGEDLKEKMHEIFSRGTAMAGEIIIITPKENPQHLRLAVSNGRLVDHAKDRKRDEGVFEIQ